MSYRKADIYVNKTKAGILEEIDSGYRFGYDSDAGCWIRLRTRLSYKSNKDKRLEVLGAARPCLKDFSENNFINNYIEFRSISNIVSENLPIIIRPLREIFKNSPFEVVAKLKNPESEDGKAKIVLTKDDP
ncbi:MAG: hypothetical protein MK198_00290 [Gracilimonas sp.]|uniref:hypothetical protein n=1 Tax=Gracilimonas sp. TaxID=1974203 RepID=UPI0037508156|nr:hypothetical protein [Gracilimonas sp.]